jgi:hypothetical protein
MEARDNARASARSRVKSSYDINFPILTAILTAILPNKKYSTYCSNKLVLFYLTSLAWIF